MKSAQTKNQAAAFRRSARIACLLPRILCIASGVAVAILMLMTVLDVGGRYFFNSPLTGTFEMTELLMAFIIFSALPIVSQKRTHITVDLLTNILSPRLKSLQAFFTDLVCGGVCLTMAWRIWLYGQRLIQRNELTLELHITIGNIACALAVLMTVTGIVFLAGSCLIFLVPKAVDKKEEL
jgi:TRAP-type C4-dicarboxylate transport system permease small subunit